MTAAADLARAIPMTATLSALGLRKVNVRKRPETGKLVVDLWHQGIRCREQTELEDTPDNRERLERLAEVIEREMREGVFDFAAVFPHSPRAALFEVPRVAAEPPPAQAPPQHQTKGRASRQERQNLPWSDEDVADLAATKGKASAMRVLAIRLGRTVRSVSERYKRLAVEVGGSAPQRTNARGRVVPWTAAELDWLRRNYAGASVETLAGSLPNRSLAAIRVRASEMGLAMPRPAAARLAISRAGGGHARATASKRAVRRPWTEEEDAVLRRRYPNEGPLTLSRTRPFKGKRTLRQLQGRAEQLQLLYRPGGAPSSGRLTQWKRHEDAVLQAHYADRGPAWIMNNRLPGRSQKAIIKRANQLGLAHSPAMSHAPGQPWTAAEVAAIEAYCTGFDGSHTPLPKLPGRSAKAVAAKVASFRKGRGTSKVIRPWAPTEDAHLLSHYPTLGAESCAKALGRSRAAVYNRANTLGLVGKQEGRKPTLRTGA